MNLEDASTRAGFQHGIQDKEILRRMSSKRQYLQVALLEKFLQNRMFVL
jgi:hypothetical protein